VIAGAHRRRQRDVEAWINRGIETGQIPDAVDVSGVAAQFAASVIGIVYTWLLSPLAPDDVQALHDGLKRQMATALGGGTR
jgi:hypothetical protein